MSEKLTLKRGSGLSFDGENWKLASDSKWVKTPQIVPHSHRIEEFMGTRMLLGVEHAVFRMLNDDYFAQPVDICRLPIPEDAMEVLYDVYIDYVEESHPAPRSKKAVPTGKFLVFKGANWKLVSDAKWKNNNGLLPDLGSPVGSKTIGSKDYNIYKSSVGFIAIASDE